MILETAEREHVTLIAMATHGRTGLSRWAFGSITEKVIRASTVPLLVLRSFQVGGSPETPESPTFDRILVPIEHSHMKIIPYIKAFAGLFGARVTLLHVVEPGENSQSRERALEELRVMAQELHKAGIQTESQERSGDPAHEILEGARKEKAGLIAMTTHGRRGATRWTLGSVTEKVVRSAEIPLLIVRNL